MPYKSSKQRAYLHIHEPELAKKWDKKYGGKIDHNFYGHMTHASVQHEEDEVENIGSGQPDADYPKSPKTDSFYDNVHRNK